MKLTGVELRRISMPLVAPFRTSFGVESTRDILLLRAVLDGPGLDGPGLGGAGLDREAEGWGECVALSDPVYSPEYVDASVDVLKRFMLPRLFALGEVDGAAVGPALEPFKGHWMSKAAIALGACSIINVKPGRVGGYLEARRIHDVCQAHGIAVWCGGMLETGIGRAANVALAALPGFTLPGDTSASDRYYKSDITEPFVLRDGCLDVPTGPGLGVTPLPAELAAVTTWTEWIPA